MSAILISASIATAQDICSDGCVEPPAPTVDCLSGCDENFSGWGHVSVQPGELACVQEGATFNGGINMNGGELRVCGTANPSYFNFNGGDVTILGTMATANLNMNSASSSLTNYGSLEVGNLNFQGAVENHGTLALSYGLNINTGGSVYNTGALGIVNDLNVNGDFLNEGTVTVGGSVNHNNQAFESECVADIAGNVNLTQPAYMAGLVTVGGTLTVNQTLTVAADAQIVAKNVTLSAPVVGPDAKCASIKVDNSTVIYSNSTLTGDLDICDANGIEVNHGTLADTVTTDCSCTPCEEPLAPLMYWTEVEWDTVNVAELGTYNEQVELFENEFGYKKSRLVLDPVEGHLFWTNTDKYGLQGLMRCNLDGSDITNIAPVGLQVTDLEIDLVNRRLYWNDDDDDAIYSVDFDGGDLQIYPGLSFIDFALDADAGIVYGLNNNDANLIAYDLATGVESVVADLSDKGILYTLEIDTINQKLYVGPRNSKYFRLNVDGTDMEALPVTAQVAWDILIHPEYDLLCWTDAVGDYIKCGDLNMENEETLTDNVAVASGLALLFR